MSKIEKSPNFNRIGKNLIRDAARYAGVTGLNFFKDSFYNQGFTDKSFEAWPSRKNNTDAGRKILIKTSSLLKSLQFENTNNKRIEFYSDEEYSNIHNNGGTVYVRVTERSRKYFWLMYRSTGLEKWKWMALTKKDRIKIVIPKRQFIGPSETLLQQLDNWLLNTIITRFKSL